MSKWHESRWEPSLDWNTPPGQLLQQCCRALAHSGTEEILVFGSSPLQMGVQAALLSGDVDIAIQGEIGSVLHACGLLQGQREPYIHLCSHADFAAASDWRSRAWSQRIEGVEVVFPHPIDILVAKVCRCEEKDMRAFEEVRSALGHPTEDELKESLQRVVDLFRPTFDEERGHDAKLNTQILWKRLFGKEIDVSKEIIAPALERRHRSRSVPQAENYCQRLAEYGQQCENSPTILP